LKRDVLWLLLIAAVALALVVAVMGVGYWTGLIPDSLLPPVKNPAV